MYNKVLNGILIVLLIAIIGTLGYLGYGYFTSYKNEKEAEKYLNEEFDTLVVDLNQKQPEEQPDENPDEQSGNNQNSGGYTYYNNQNTGYYRGYLVAGKLEMPSIGKQFPILDEPNKANAMDVSVVKVYGPNLNTPGNVVIGGHNNNNGTFFSNNKKLQIGDKIYITDLTGQRLSYTIYEKFYTPGSDSTWFNRQIEAGQVEVTLYTCDATGANRLIIYARAD